MMSAAIFNPFRTLALLNQAPAYNHQSSRTNQLEVQRTTSRKTVICRICHCTYKNRPKYWIRDFNQNMKTIAFYQKYKQSEQLMAYFRYLSMFVKQLPPSTRREYINIRLQQENNGMCEYACRRCYRHYTRTEYVQYLLKNLPFYDESSFFDKRENSNNSHVKALKHIASRCMDPHELICLINTMSIDITHMFE